MRINFLADRLSDKQVNTIAIALTIFLYATSTFSNSLFGAATFLVALFAIATIPLKVWVKSLRGWHIFFGVFLICVIVSACISIYPDESLRGVFKTVKSLFMCFAMMLLFRRGNLLQRFVAALSALSIILSLDCYWQACTGFDLIRHRPMTPYLDGAARMTGPFKHANDLAAYLIVIVPILMASTRESLRIKEYNKVLLHGVALLLTASVLMFTYSRGAWIALLLAITLFFILTRDLKAILIMIVLMSIGCSMASPALRNRAFSIFTEGSSGTTLERQVLWGESWQMIKERPFLGRGINTFSRFAPMYKSHVHKTDVQYAHNGYLQMAVEIGLFGLVTFITLLGAILVVGFKAVLCSSKSRNISHVLAMGCGLVAFLIYSFFDTGMHSTKLIGLFWAQAGIFLSFCES